MRSVIDWPNYFPSAATAVNSTSSLYFVCLTIRASVRQSTHLDKTAAETTGNNCLSFVLTMEIKLKVCEFWMNLFTAAVLRACKISSCYTQFNSFCATITSRVTTMWWEKFMSYKTRLLVSSSSFTFPWACMKCVVSNARVREARQKFVDLSTTVSSSRILTWRTVDEFLTQIFNELINF